MPVARYSAIACAVVLAGLFVSSAHRADDSGYLRFDGSLYDGALYAPRRTAVEVAEPGLARDVTPAGRVREAFAVFVPHERRRGKRDT